MAIERANAPGLCEPPGYSHVVVASGSRLVTPAGAVPLDAEGNLWWGPATTSRRRGRR